MLIEIQTCQVIQLPPAAVGVGERLILSKYYGEIYLPVVVAGVDRNLELVLLLVVDRHPACGVPCCTEWDNPVIGPRDSAYAPLMP